MVFLRLSEYMYSDTKNESVRIEYSDTQNMAVRIYIYSDTQNEGARIYIGYHVVEDMRLSDTLKDMTLYIHTSEYINSDTLHTRKSKVHTVLCRHVHIVFPPPGGFTLWIYYVNHPSINRPPSSINRPPCNALGMCI